MSKKELDAIDKIIDENEGLLEYFGKEQYLKAKTNLKWSQRNLNLVMILQIYRKSFKQYIPTIIA